MDTEPLFKNEMDEVIKNLRQMILVNSAYHAMAKDPKVKKQISNQVKEMKAALNDALSYNAGN